MNVHNTSCPAHASYIGACDCDLTWKGLPKLDSVINDFDEKIGSEYGHNVILGAAVKDDSGKLRYDLIPPRALDELARVYTIGAKKYSDRNWENGFQWGRIFAAMMRHGWAFWRGEERDPVDGQLHLSSVAWCAFALMEFTQTHPELDDRPKGGRCDGKVYPVGPGTDEKGNPLR